MLKKQEYDQNGANSKNNCGLLCVDARRKSTKVQPLATTNRIVQLLAIFVLPSLRVLH